MNAQQNNAVGRRQPSAGAARFHPSRAGFTLVELIVAVSIIVILAGITLRALSMARDSGREYRTKATISKLDRIIREMYASYRNRRVPIDTTGLDPRTAIGLQLAALRQTILFEMPERYGDVPENPQPVTISYNSVSRPLMPPGASYAYSAVLAGHRSNPADNSHAECLYMIVAISNPERLEDFQASEIGDTDGDGLPEFVDGWGRPIYFLRWAPQFPDSDIQTIDASDPDFRHDPFDTHNLQPSAPLLLPLVYSAGPDGDYGINPHQDYNYAGEPWGSTAGQPTGDGTHYDNIHNHRIEQR